MIGALAPLHGALAASARRRLVSRGRIDAPLSLSRAQVNTSATALGADGVTWNSFAANQPRFAGTARRLLLGGQRTNGVRNPRGENIPSITYGPGVNNTLNMGSSSWWNPNRGSGLSLDVSPITANGMSGVRLRYYGTSSATPGPETVEFDARTAFSFPGGSTIARSFFYRLAAGALPAGMLPLNRILGLDAAQALVLNTTGSALPMNGTVQRSAEVVTVAGSVVIASMSLHMVSFPASTPCDFTIDLFWPQIEVGTFASTPVLPPVGSAQASTRGADTVAAPFATLFPGFAGTVLVSCMIQSTQASRGLGQVLLCADNGAGDRHVIELSPGSGTLLLRPLLANSGPSVSLGSIAQGTAFRLGMTWDATGRLAASLNGAATTTATGGPASGLTTLRLGNSPAGNQALSGEVLALDTLPFAVPGAALPGLVAALPV